jgi:hypothetical protein
MLTSDQVCQFENQGFTTVRGLVSPEELTRYTTEISEGQTLEQHDDRVEMETNQEANGILVRRIVSVVNSTHSLRSGFAQ